MEDKVKVRLVRLADYRTELLGICSIAQDLFSVVDELKDEHRVGFEVTFPFGCPVVEKGEMILQKLGPVKSFWPELSQPPKQVVWEDGVQDRSPDEVFAAFKASCSRSTDHALSIILDNEVEVYSWRHINHQLPSGGVLPEQKKFFPLEHLSRGQLLGLFGISDMIAASLRGDKPRPDAGQPWSAVAGRRCVSLEVPKPLKQQSPSLYRKNFVELFPTAKELLVDVRPKDSKTPDLRAYGDILPTEYESTISDTRRDGIISKMEEVVYSTLCRIMREEGNDSVRHGTRILIIPDNYIAIDNDDDKPELMVAKIRLQRTLLAGAWHQSEGLRDSAWKQGLITSGSELVVGHHARSVLNHMLDVLDSKAFAIRPVSESDRTLFSAWQVLCDRWSHYHLWKETCFPLMVTYSRGLPDARMPYLVLPLLLPLNSLSIEIERLYEVVGQSAEIGAVLKRYAAVKEVDDFTCDFYSSHEDALEHFMEYWKVVEGDRVVGRQMEKGGQTNYRLVQGRVRTAKGGNLKTYQSGAFILRRG